MTVYIGSNEKANAGGGTYSFEITADGKLSQKAYIPLDGVMYTCTDGGTKYILLREYTGGESGMIKASVGPDGSLTQFGETLSTRGVCACHITARDGDVYAVNYSSGSVIRFPDTVDRHTGSGPVASRQEGPHTHCVMISPDGKFVAVTDLGADTITVYDRSLKKLYTAKADSGSGPRHIVFSRDGEYLYCVNELTSDVSAYRWNGGKPCLASSAGTETDKNIYPSNTGAAIRLSTDGKHIYTTNRGEDTINVFSVDGERIRLVQKASCGGRCPNDICLTPDGRFIVCTNLYSNSVTVFSTDGAKIAAMTCKIDIPMAFCAEAEN